MTIQKPQLSLDTTTNSLNVRCGPGTDPDTNSYYIEVGLIAGGSTTKYDILGKDADTATWYQIRFSDTITGWVHGDYVQTHGSLTGLKVTWGSTASKLSLGPAVENLNVYAGPGTSHHRVVVSPGNHFIVEEEKENRTKYVIMGKDAATAGWYQICVKAMVTGWVRAAHVQTHGDLGTIS